MDNIYVLDKNYHKIGTLSNQGVKPFAPYFNDLYTQELETGADTYEFSTISNKYTQDCMEIGHHIMFVYKNRNELFTITSIEYSHNEGYKTIGVYAESVGFELLDVYMHRPEKKKSRATNDSDGDGDDNTDDEYADPDDVYIDENGNIIYDKNGGTKPSEEEVTIDGDGNIIYRPSKNNKKNDSLEFKNISYPTFLKLLLKNSGWSYVCQPGLESIKHDITVKYDTNIFAILQDSMQSYRGVELEFVYEYNNGKVKKVIKAYKDGGRGSFVGKRFEYGVNVKGITKNQEVANSQDDTVLYVDNVGIAVSYDVDFALKSAEIPEIEIGDTHYVIDNDFCPPMQIKARIGKIEISFSDPTRNKIYLANNKKISGSAIDDELSADDVADILDDYEYGNDGAAYDHYHDRLISKYEKTYVSDDGKTKVTATRQTSVELSEKKLLPGQPEYYSLGDIYTPWYALHTRAVFSNDFIQSPRYSGYGYNVYYDRSDMEDIQKITNSGYITKQDLLNFVVNDLNVYEYSATEVNEAVNRDVDDPDAYFPNQIYFGILSEDVVTHSNTCRTSKVGSRISKGTVRSDTNNDGDQNTNDTHDTHSYSISSLLCCLIGAFQHYVSGGKPSADPSPKDEDYEYGGGVNPGGGRDPGDDTDPDNPSTGTITSTFDVAEGNKLIANTVEATLFDGYQADLNILTVGDYIQLPDGTKIYGKGDFGSPGDNDAPDSGGGTPSNPSTPGGSGGSCEACLSDNFGGYRFAGDLVPSSYIENGNARPSIDTFIRLTNDVDTNYHRMQFALRENWSSDFDNLGITFKTPDEGFSSGIDVYSVFGPDSTSGRIDLGSPNANECGRWNTIYSHNALNTCDIKYKENVIYLDELLEAQTYSSNNEAETPFLDFIKNDFRPALYNYKSQEGSDIRQEDNQLGFIANDIIDTEVGGTFLYDFGKDGEQDIMVSSSGYTTVVARALQEEIRTRDEKIASLEDRLARLEALLGIDNK